MPERREKRMAGTPNKKRIFLSAIFPIINETSMLLKK